MVVIVRFKTRNTVTQVLTQRLHLGFSVFGPVRVDQRLYQVQTVRPDSADLAAEIHSVCEQLRAIVRESGNEVKVVTEVHASRTRG